MSHEMTTALVTIVTAIIGLAVLAVLVSRNANTAGVIGAGGSALAADISAAVAPVTGGGIGTFSTAPIMNF